MAKKGQETDNSKKTAKVDKASNTAQKKTTTSTKSKVNSSKNNSKVVKEEKVTEDVVIKEKEKKEKSDKRVANEKLAKMLKKEKKHNNFFKALTEDKTFSLLIAFIVGVGITTVIAVAIWPDRIATLEDGNQPVATIDGKIITANELYEEMKDYYDISQILNDVDKIVLEKLYPEDETMVKEAEDKAEQYISLYKQSYNYEQDAAIQAMGFGSYDDLIDYLKLDNRRTRYVEDYIKNNLSDQDIENYYNDNVYGAINCQHILVKTSDKVSDDDAKAKAQEIIDKLKNGSTWDQVKEEYKDSTTFEDLSYQEWNANLESTFLSALKDLKENSYSTEPIKTSYGYHVIYRLDQKEKPSLKDSKDAIISKLVENKKSEDSNITAKALISLREETGLTFSDTVIEGKYKSYTKKYK